MNDHDLDNLSKQAKEMLKEITNRAVLSPKDKINIPAQEMPCQNKEVRNKNFKEVALGYTKEQAKLEAIRCLQCKTKPCMNGCPVKIDIPAFIQAIANDRYQEAIHIIKKNSLLPAICGRVCPQETQCQEHCIVGKSLKDVEKAVSIGRLERFIADWEIKNRIQIPEVKPDTGKKVAIVGCGPAGLVVAADTRREGHSVTIFEALHKPGGVMTYGIPEFRLPNNIIDVEISTLRSMGVEIKTDFVIGRTRKLTDLIEKDGFDAVFIGTGAGLPNFMNIEGENLIGIYSANEYLTRSNLMLAFNKDISDTPIMRSKRVAVFGGGNVAMDAVRTAIRLGAEEAHIIYRRTEKEMPARTEEIQHAKEEGVQFHLLQNAKRYIGDSNGKVIQIECIKYKLGEPDTSGRARPIEIPGSEFLMDIDTVIVAVGNSSNPLLAQTTPNLNFNKWGNILVDKTGKTSIDNIYAGGDIVLGAATVILAMGQGRTAAASINKQLK